MKTCWGPWIAGCLLLAATSATAGSTLGSGVARAALDFAIRIPPMVRAEARSDPASLHVTSEDARRGYVDLDDASSVVLTSNARPGFMLAIAFDSGIVGAVDLRMVGRTVTAAASGDALLVHAGPLAGKRVLVSYRLHLAPGVRAGEYRWPLAVTYAAAAI